MNGLIEADAGYIGVELTEALLDRSEDVTNGHNVTGIIWHVPRRDYAN